MRNTPRSSESVNPDRYQMPRHIGEQARRLISNASAARQAVDYAGAVGVRNSVLAYEADHGIQIIDRVDASTAARNPQSAYQTASRGAGSMAISEQAQPGITNAEAQEFERIMAQETSTEYAAATSGGTLTGADLPEDSAVEDPVGANTAGLSRVAGYEADANPDMAAEARLAAAAAHAQQAANTPPAAPTAGASRGLYGDLRP